MNSKEIARKLYELRVSIAFTNDDNQLNLLKVKEEQLLQMYKDVILQEAYLSHSTSNNNSIEIKKRGR